MQCSLKEETALLLMYLFLLNFLAIAYPDFICVTDEQRVLAVIHPDLPNQFIREPLVVRIEKSQEFAGRTFDAGVACRGYAAMLLK